MWECGCTLATQTGCSLSCSHGGHLKKVVLRVLNPFKNVQVVSREMFRFAALLHHADCGGVYQASRLTVLLCFEKRSS